MFKVILTLLHTFLLAKCSTVSPVQGYNPYLIARNIPDMQINIKLHSVEAVQTIHRHTNILPVLAIPHLPQQASITPPNLSKLRWSQTEMLQAINFLSTTWSTITRSPQRPWPRTSLVISKVDFSIFFLSDTCSSSLEIPGLVTIWSSKP